MPPRGSSSSPGSDESLQRSVLTSLTDPLGNKHSFTYGGNGYLLKDINAIPGSAGTRLIRTQAANNWSTTLTTAEGRTKSHTVDFSPSGLRSELRTHVAPSGVYATDAVNVDGTRTITSFDGSSAQLSSSSWGTTADPRWGLSLPFTTSSTVATGSHSATRSSARSVVGGSPSNPFAFSSITDSTTVTDSAYTFKKTFDATASTLTTSALDASQVMQLSVQQKLDSLDRVIEIDPQGTAPGGAPLFATTMSYLGSKLQQTSQGTGASNDPSRRTYTMNYDAGGRLTTIDTPLGASTIAFGNFDADGRPQQKTLPGGRMMNFTYDAAGNRLAVQEPKGAGYSHAFTPNAVNLLGSYTPPSPSTGSTQYTYDRDELLTQLLAPVAPVTYAYDSMGRLSSVSYTSPADSSLISATWSYDAASRPTSIAGSGTGAASLGYAYEAGTNLLASETFSGPWGSAQVAVSKTYDASQRVQTRSVVGSNPVANGAVGYSYDHANRLRQVTVGTTTYTLNYQPLNGLLSSSSFATGARTVTETYSYDSYGGVGETRSTLNGSQILDFQYSRDAMGRVTNKTEQQAGPWHSWVYD